MTTTDPAQESASRFSRTDDVARGSDSDNGWLLFSGAMLGILATMNFIYGIAAVSKSTFLVGNAEFVVADLKTWGWILMLLGAAQLVTAFGVLSQWDGVRWIGVTFASLNAIAQLLVMPAYPLWAVCLFLLDILVIYGLVAHGARRS
jgi:hypothetical protein